MPSSRTLAKEMVKPICFEGTLNIVELGPGTGVFSSEILSRMNKNSKLFVIESNEVFAKNLENKYCNDTRMVVIHGSAENINTYLKSYNIELVDFVISGLPFTSLPENMSTKILTNVKKIIKPQGSLITFQYTLIKKGLFKKYFPQIETKKVYKNIPPAYVLNCSN